MTLLKPRETGWHRGTTGACSAWAEIEPALRGRGAAFTVHRHKSQRTGEDFAYAAVEKGTE